MVETSRATVWPVRERTVRLAGRPVTVLVPVKEDPRVIEGAALLAAVVIRIVAIRQPLSAPQLVLALGVPIVLDVLITYLRRKVIVAPASALISGLIIALVLQTSEIWPYAAAGAIAMLSKHLIRTADRPVFNPSALALAVLLAVPNLAQPAPASWSQHAPQIIALIVGVGGVIVTAETRMLDMVKFLVWSYTFLILSSAILVHAVHGEHSISALVVDARDALSTVEYNIITVGFFILSDPRTAPIGVKRGRPIYALFVSILGFSLAAAGLNRVLGLLIAVLVGNVFGLLVLDRIFPYVPEEVDLSHSQVPPPFRPIVWLIKLPFRLLRRRTAPDPIEAVPSVSASPSTAPEMRPVPTPRVAETVLLPTHLDLKHMPYLVLQDEALTHYPLSSPMARVGRASDNDLCLHAPGVSRYHAVLRQAGGQVVLEDLGSTNGTFVNGTRVQGQALLHDGDRVRFGGEKAGISVVVRQPQQAVSVPSARG